MENPEFSAQPLEKRMSHLAKIWGKTYILGTREEADRDVAFTLQPWS